MQPKREEDFFWEGVDEDRLLVQCCSECSALRHPPRPMCPECQSLGWQAQQLSGKGIVFSWLISKHPSKPDVEPRTVVLVDMDEGIRLVGNMLNNESVAIGDQVASAFGDFHGMRLPMFTKEAGQ